MRVSDPLGMMLQFGGGLGRPTATPKTNPFCIKMLGKESTRGINFHKMQRHENAKHSTNSNQNDAHLHQNASQRGARGGSTSTKCETFVKFTPAKFQNAKHSTNSNLQYTYKVVLRKKNNSDTQLSLEASIKNGSFWPNRARLF